MPKIIYALMALLLLSSAAFASPAKILNGNINQSLLSAAISQVNCKTNFTASFVNQLDPYLPNSSSTLNSDVSLLNQYSGQLSGFAHQGNVRGYSDYVRATYDPELVAIASSIIPDLKSARLNITTLLQIRNDYSSQKSSYEQCSLDSLKAFAQAKIELYQMQLSESQQVADNLSSKGVDVSALDSEISSANTTVITPFQNAINSASNSTQMLSAINTYCLYDGCRNGINFHFDAHFALYKLQAILATAQSVSNVTANQTARLTTAQNDLNSASSILTQVGTSQYTPNQTKELWSDLQIASKQLRTFILSVR